MPTLSPGARQLPPKHISIRVPWHDSAWDGTTCQDPCANTSCLILPRIREFKRDPEEDATRGKSWEKLSIDQLPACEAERGAIMAPFEFTRSLTHPYSDSSKSHEHFDTTSFVHPPYSANCIPFAWMLRDGAAEKVEQLGLSFDTDAEDALHEEMRFETNWTQVKHNQLALLDTFFSAIRPDTSLCFIYAKDTPLAEDPRRVIVGVGRVTGVGPSVEYRYKEEGTHKAVLWDRIVQHSIRPGFANGFLFPYQKLLEQAAVDPSLDPSAYVAFAPDESWHEFSFASEHVSHDSAIGALLICADTLRRIGTVVPGDWDRQLAWIDTELNRLWQLRGPFPGLGSALKAFGFSSGNLVAHDLGVAQEGAKREWNEDPWPLVDRVVDDPSLLSGDLGGNLDRTLCKAYLTLKPERKVLLKLLSRFNLTEEQATRFYQETEREKAGIVATDADLIANPYRLYELDRSQVDPVSVRVIDRGLCPDPVVREKHPVPEPSTLDGDTDARRVRALVVEQLERQASSGHTLQARGRVLQAIRDLELSPRCPVSQDLLPVVEPSFQPEVSTASLADGSAAYQLRRLQDVAEVIRSTVRKRRSGRRFSSAHDWSDLVSATIGEGVVDDQEQRAHDEKAAALAELFAARLSVLTGSAGTGKTTLLKALCNLSEVQRDGLLLLAPTGKARVRMETQIGISGGQTIAQFLVRRGRYDPRTGRYHLSTADKDPQSYGTVIIDEASMLTEEQLAALVDGLQPPKRLILVGDPQQLPPIGAGRPFVDIVRELTPDNFEGVFPRVAPGIAELTILRRHKGQDRDDLLLAGWFTGRRPGAGGDEIWDRLAAGGKSEHIELVSWQNEEQLHGLLLDHLRDTLGLQGDDDENTFELSLGGSAFRDAVYFRSKYKDHPGAASQAEAWQILSPIRAGNPGVESVNRLIQERFRKRALEWATPEVYWQRKTPKPMGRSRILYGDKVINLINARRKDVYPKDGLGYLANGEIGIVVGQYKGRSWKPKKLPWKLEVEFSSQLGYKYGFGGRDFREEGDSPLELAYALTIHKTQGSEFGTTILILPNPCRLLTPELLYTALTRQKDRVIILHQGDLADLRQYSRTYFSETARRLTNLLTAPTPVQLEDRFLEDGLIHKTRRGDAVRSKSEVVIADLLHSLKVDYRYEQEFRGHDGSRRWPDFTIEDQETGLLVLWEHLGMLDKLAYRERWERKLAWYKESGILQHDAGGGANGTLVVTKDDARGGIDSAEIESLARKVLTP